tara:strand:- start:649 stop:1041 length:393 start_codon:yes stop_codon:yes gene_type:complete
MIEEVVKQVSDMTYYKKPLYKVQFIKHIRFNGDETNHEDVCTVQRHTGIYTSQDGPIPDTVFPCKRDQYRYIQMVREAILINPEWIIKQIEEDGVYCLHDLGTDYPNNNGGMLDVGISTNIHIYKCERIN